MKSGDKLWFVPAYTWQGYPRYVSIEKVGRLYVTMANGHRLTKGNLAVAGENGRLRGTYYLSKEAYELEAAIRKELVKFKRLVNSLDETDTDMRCLQAATEALKSFSNAIAGVTICQ